MSLDTPDPQATQLPLQPSQQARVRELEREMEQQALELETVRKEVRELMHDARNSVGFFHGLTELNLLGEFQEDARNNVDFLLRLTTSLLVDMRNNISCTDFLRLLSESIQHTAKRLKSPITPELHISIDEEEAAQRFILASQVHLDRIIEILLSNSLRKDPQHVTIDASFSDCLGDGTHGLQLVYRDKGLGMSPEVLAKIRAEQSVTDRPDDGKKHGIGLESLRTIVTKRYGGIIDVDSTERSVDAQNGGTTFTLCFPVFVHHPELPVEELPQVAHTESISTEPTVESVVLTPEPIIDDVAVTQARSEPSVIIIPPSHSSPLPSSHRFPRRAFVGGTVAAGLLATAGYFGLRRTQNKESNEQPDVWNNVLQAELNPNGHIAQFDFDIGGRALHYERDGKSEGFARIERVDFHDISIIGCDVKMDREEEPVTMFLMANQGHVFGELKRQHQNGIETAYVCSPVSRRNTEHPPINRSHIFPLKDAFFDTGRFASISYPLLADGNFQALAPSFAPLIHFHPKNHPQFASNEWIPHAQRVITKFFLRKAHYDRAHRNVSTVEDWHEALQQKIQCIVVEPDSLLMQHLREHPLNNEKTRQLLIEQQNTVCLPRLHPQEANRLIRV